MSVLNRRSKYSKEEKKKKLEIKGSDEETELALHHQLQNWFETQTKWKSYAEIGRATEIDPADVSKYFRGIKKPGKKVCQKLSTIIDIELLRQEAEKKSEEEKEIGVETHEIFEMKKEHEEIKTPLDLQEKVAELQKIILDLSEKVKSFEGMCENCIVNKLPSSTDESSIKERVEIVKELLYALNKELEFFKQASPESREMFRKRIHAPDVGYIIALLRALFDEDKFQSWLYMSSYDMKRR